MDNTEHLKFRIGLSGTFWNKRPAYSILINGKELTSGYIQSESDCIEFHEFECDLIDDQIHELQIRLNNKENSDVEENEDRTEIIKDMLLNISSIEIDDISLDKLLWLNSEFVPDDKSKPTLDRCVNLGWNGTYILKFSTPVYLWLLENM